MNDNKSNVGGEAMDELIARLREQANTTADEVAPATEDSGDDEIRRLLLGQLENSGKERRSDVPKIDESLSLDEFEDEEEPVEEEIVDEKEIVDEEEPVDEEELIEEEMIDDYLDEDEIFEEDIDGELFDTEESLEIEEETVTEETVIDDGAVVEDDMLISEEDADDVEEPALFDPAPAIFAPEISTVQDVDVDGYDGEEEPPDEAQISIDLTEIDAFSPEVDGVDEEEYVPRAQPDASEARAASTDTAINGITPDEVLLSTIAAQVDEKTRARLMGIDLSEPMPVAEEDEESAADESAEEAEGDETVEPEEAETTESGVQPEKAEEIPVADPLQTGFDNERIRSNTRVTANNAAPWQSDGDGDVEDADVEMLLRLGYEQSLRRTVGDERVERIKQEKLAAESINASAKKPFGYRGREYSGRDMTADTQRAYAHDRARILARLVATAVFAFVLLIFDELPLIADVSRSLWSIVSPFVGSFAYPLIGAALLLLALTPSLPQLFGGVRGAMRLEPNIYSIPAISAAVALANSIGLIFRGAGVIPSLFGGAALVILLIAVVADLCALHSQELAFSVVSSGKEKFLASDGVYSSEGNGTETVECYNVRRAQGMSSYFARTAKYAGVSSFINYLIPVGFAVSIIFGGFGLLRTGSFWTAIRSSVTAYFLLTPALFALGTTLPLWLSNKIINHRGCAVIGSAAAEDYTPDTRFGREKKIFFPDSDVLSAAHVKRITLRGDKSAEHYVALAEKMFYVLGGVLQNEGVKGDEPPAVDGVHIEIADSSEHYLKLYMIDGDETVEVVMGSYDKLTRSGIKLPNENMERVYNDDRRDKLVVYLAFDGQFRIAYSIRYKLSTKFCRAARRLAELGFVPSVETFDPMVTRQLLDELMTEARLDGQLSICRADHFDGARPRQSCGIVATKSSLNLYYPLVSCQRIRRSYGDVKRLSVILTCVGAAAMTAVLACGVLVFVRPWMALVWQLLGAGIFALLTASRINEGALSMSLPSKKTQKPKEKTKKSKKTRVQGKQK